MPDFQHTYAVNANSCALVCLFSLQAYLEYMGFLLFSDENRSWNEVFDAAAKKSDMLKIADEKLTNAKASVSNAIDKIEAGNKDSSFCENDTLKQADVKANNAVKDLEKVVAALDNVQKEAKLVDEYRNLVEEGKQQFQKEIEAILPERKLGNAALTEEELNIFMTHAYRLVYDFRNFVHQCARNLFQRILQVLSNGYSTLPVRNWAAACHRPSILSVLRAIL